MKRLIKIQAILWSLMLVLSTVLVPMTALAAENGDGGDGIQLELQSTKVSVPAGQKFTYEIKYSVSSTTIHYENAKIVLPIPNGIKYDSVAGANDGIQSEISPDQRTVTFTFTKPLQAGATGTLHVNVLFPNYITPNGTTVETQAIFSSGQNPGGKQSNKVKVAATASANWKLEKERSKPVEGILPFPGSEVEYKITLFDAKKGSTGNLEIRNVSITDKLPPGAQFISSRPISPNGQAGNVLTWNIGNLGENGGPKEIWVKVKYPEDQDIVQPVTNLAEVHYTPLGESAPVTKDAKAVHGFTKDPKDDGTWYWKTVSRNQKERSPGQTVDFYIGGLSSRANVDLKNAVVTDMTPKGTKLTHITTSKFAGIDSYLIQLKEEGKNWSDLRTVQMSNYVEEKISIPDGTDAAGVRFVFGDKIPVDFHQEDSFGLRYKISDNFDELDSYIFKEQPSDPEKPEEDLDYQIDKHLDRNKPRKMVLNKVELTYEFNGDSRGPFVREVKVGVVSPRPLIDVSKKATNGSNFVPGSIVKYKISVRNSEFSSDKFHNPIVTDLLPSELEYIEGTAKWIDGSGAKLGQPDFTAAPDFNGTGRTLLKWEWTEAQPATLDSNKRIEFEFEARVKAGTRTGDIKNEVEVTSNKHDYLNSHENFGKNRERDGRWYVYNDTSIYINSIAKLDSIKLVQGDLDGGKWTRYPESGNVTPGGVIKYKLSVTNTGNIPVKNVLIVDALPHLGDRGVIDKAPRDSKWSPILTEKVNVPKFITVYYSTDTDASMTGGHWSQEPPTDLTTVQALKFEFDKSYVMEPGQSEDLLLTMRAPVGAPTDGNPIAWNSFGFSSVRADDNTPMLTAEPPKVGVKLVGNPKAEIGDYVWFDKNGNGIQDEGSELGVNGVRVELHRASDGKLLNTTLTGNNHEGKPGYYLFTGLEAGDYFVKFQLPDGYAGFTKKEAGPDKAINSKANSDGKTDNITLGASEKNHTIDAGLIKKDTPLPKGNGAIGKYVWIDTNGNGIQDDGDTGLNGVTVELYNGSSTKLASTVTRSVYYSAVTNSVYDPSVSGSVYNPGVTDYVYRSGYYLFDNLDAGKYVVKFILPDGYKFTLKNAGDDRVRDSDARPDGTTDVINLGQDERNLTIDAGLVRKTVDPDPDPVKGAIGDYIWIDENGNGIQDEGPERGVNGLRVDLYREGETAPMRSVVTGNDVNGNPGYYLFTDLDAGKYIVKFHLPDGFEFTKKNAGDDRARDSDAYPDGTTDVIILAQGERNLTIDAGLIRKPVEPVKGAIGKYVWIDTNGNGIQDDGDTGVNGVTVELYDASGKLLRSTVTATVYDSSVTGSVYGKPGYYLFDNLDAGTYKVRFILPAGYDFTKKNIGDDRSRDSDAYSDGWSDAITLAQGERNLTVDAGLIVKTTWPGTNPGTEGPGSGNPGGGTSNPGTGTEQPKPSNPGSETGTNPSDDTNQPGDGTQGENDGTQDGDNEDDAGDTDLGGETDSNNPNKPGTLPQTGEEAPIAPIVGTLLCASALVMWFARKKIFVER